jgi:hypothetical protein
MSKVQGHRLTAAFLALVAWLAWGAPAARATGTVRIQQSDGSVNTYDDVGIKIIHEALYVTSADGKGTLVINRAACGYQQQILVCLPTTVTLVQAGSVKKLDLKTGTLYLNLTGSDQPLVLSTTKIPPHGLLFTFSTDVGTYVTLSGTVDKVTK